MFWSTLGRMIVVPIAFIVSTLVAMFVLLSLGYERIVQATAGAAGTGGFDAIFDLLSQGALIASGITILPALALVIIGEVARIKSALYYVLGGGAALAAIPLLARIGQQATAAGPSTIVMWQVFATAGFAGGFMYWLLAGRRA
jgi:hypothetical protein